MKKKGRNETVEIVVHVCNATLHNTLHPILFLCSIPVFYLMTWHLLLHRCRVFLSPSLFLSLSLLRKSVQCDFFFPRILYSRFWFTFTSHHHWRGPPTHFSSLDEILSVFYYSLFLSFFSTSFGTEELSRNMMFQRKRGWGRDRTTVQGFAKRD